MEEREREEMEEKRRGDGIFITHMIPLASVSLLDLQHTQKQNQWQYVSVPLQMDEW